MDAVDAIAFLSASRQRASVVSTLHDEGPLTRNDLVERCDAARVTVGRNLERLDDRGLLREEGNAYALSLVGELLAGEFLSLLETARAAEELSPVLEHIPPEEFDFDPRALVGADVTASTRSDPYAPVDRHGRTLETATEARMLLPAVGTRPMDASLDRVVAGDLELEFVVSSDLAATLRSAEYADRIRRMLDSGNVTIEVYDGEIPYYLGLVDDSVQIGVDEEGIPRALAESDDPTVREWAETTYESYRSAAEPFDAG